MAALSRYDVLGTPSEAAFDEVVEMVATICDTPMSVINFVGASQVWLKAKLGLDAEQMPRDMTFCTHVVEGRALLVVEDARTDARFAANPLVTGAPRVRFYAGMPLVTPDGQVIGSLCAVDTRPRSLDETQKRALAVLARHVMGMLELRHQSQQLSRVTADLEEKRRVADAASEAKSKFLANMSHELRTPMNGVMTATELLLETSLDASQRDDVITIRKCAEGLVAILNDVLDVARVESGRLTLEKEPVDLRLLVKDVLAMLRPTAVAKDISLKASFDLEVPEQVVGDALRLRQVLVNLVGNAIKFTARGSVAVEVRRAERSDPRHPAIELVVTDTGIGVPLEKREAIFEPFVQAESSTTRRFGGTGLGLAIVRQLVSAMGGAVRVEDGPSGGAQFVANLRLEACSPSGVMRAARATGQFRAVRDPANLPATRVLLAEDDAINRKLVTRLLERLGCKVCAVPDGVRVIEATAMQTFDLVLMDVEMPEVDGYHATRQIRRAERVTGGRTPIVAMTAHVLPETRAACVEAGMDGYLAKPVGMAELQGLLEQWQASPYATNRPATG